jgi:hypothetical protein
MIESTLSEIVNVVDKLLIENGLYEKYMVPWMDDKLRCGPGMVIWFNAPSRIITSNKRPPLPIVNALHRVSENTAMSKMSTPVHAKAPSVPSSYWGRRDCYLETYVDL